MQYLLTNKIIIPANSIKAKIIITIPHIFTQCVLDSPDKALYIFVPSSYFAYDINLEIVLTVLKVALYPIKNKTNEIAEMTSAPIVFYILLLF